jgi:hypothetical protein
MRSRQRSARSSARLATSAARAADDQRSLLAVDLDRQIAHWLAVQRVGEPEDGGETQRGLLIVLAESQKRRLAVRAQLLALEGHHTGDDRLLVGR